MPDIANAHYMLVLPRVRDLEIHGPIKPQLNIRQLMAFAIQVTGTELGNPCTNCRRRNGSGPLNTCVNMDLQHLENLKDFWGTYAKACASCLYHMSGNSCSVRGSGVRALALGGVPRKRQLKLESEYGHVADDERSVFYTAEAEGGETKAFKAELTNRSLKREIADVDARRPYAPPINPGALVIVRPQQHLASQPVGSGPMILQGEALSHNDLEMEEWERGEGQLVSRTASGRDPTDSKYQISLLLFYDPRPF
jgi:hypothetical protein